MKTIVQLWGGGLYENRLWLFLWFWFFLKGFEDKKKKMKKFKDKEKLSYSLPTIFKSPHEKKEQKCITLFFFIISHLS